MTFSRLPTRSGRASPAEWMHSCLVHATQPAEVSRACAYPVPWRVSRRGADGAVELENTSDRVLRQVRFTLGGAGLLRLSLPARLLPGDRIEVGVRGVLDASGEPRSPDAVLVVRWVDPDGAELLWPVTW